MKATFLIGTLVVMAACAEQQTYQQGPAATAAASGQSASYTPPQANPCNRSDYPSGAAGDADYANCVIQN